MHKEAYELSERKKLILRTIIDAYIAGGEPVGSKFLTTNKRITLSSATIRNEMAELEEMGYLTQPHTSAGRIPSEKGYRFYVDSLMRNYRLSSDELRALNNLVQNKISELDSVLEYAGRLVSSLTNYTSLTVKPRTDAVKILRYKILKLNSDGFLLIMITATQTVKTKYIHMTSATDDDGLIRLERALNELMCDIDMNTVTMPLMMQLQAQLVGYDSQVSPVMRCIYEAANESDSGDLKLDGVNRLLQYPEFNNIDTLSSMLEVLERKEDILDVVSKSDKRLINIYIGNEIELAAMRHTSLVFKTISSGSHVVGAIGVIGPCRMDYSKVITTVEYLTLGIAGMISDEEEDSDIYDGYE
ncbi:MAG: heat-inducible transcriptional repressor HrcA [Eubacteriales bacterium]|nr:heat-inducible transcriptional repressor HrcA [Eubacteriales bacterium]